MSLFDIDTINYIKLISLKSVLNPDEAYLCRQLIRWFSKTFNVSILEAQEIPILEILQHNFEDQYENLKHDPEKKEELILLMKELTENEQQKAERLKTEAKEEMSDQAFLQNVANKIKDQETNLNKLKQESNKQIVPTNDEFKDFNMSFSEVLDDDLKENESKIDKDFSLLFPIKKK